MKKISMAATCNAIFVGRKVVSDEEVRISS